MPDQSTPTRVLHHVCPHGIYWYTCPLHPDEGPHPDFAWCGLCEHKQRTGR